MIIDDVIKLVKRSGCNLLRLTYFGDKSFSVSVQLALLLSLSPSLVELEANDSISDFTCGCLERKLQPVITPRLRSLIIHIEHRIKKELLVVDAQRFNALAQRCCSQNRISRRDSDCVRLDVLGLRFEYPEQCLWFQQALQMWRYDPTDWSVLQNCVKELQEIDEELEDVFCCFAFDIEDQTSRMRTRLQTVLRTLEELPDLDPRILLSSNIVFYLWRMKTHSGIEDDIQRHIIESENTLRQKWIAHANTYNLTLNWVREDFESLTYIPDATETVGCGERFLYGL
ncbi:hypothetical protein Agabi119p4_2361 [Agaricus bisporus var. burnettii]|uniref:Uncharacterized protein n=1 Tax=Agaricus bisporus var. burnettii TaxID=192524 RepID=A0A8H7KKA9_AGABI|nr:hypothetical protein Agabi119p4_2361 [Agaricus bisporus var. burnettii]